jgi:mono/diheme cytochrome c family protein
MNTSLKLLILTAALALGTASAQTATGDANRGKDLFGKKYMCYTCHGWDGHGGAGATLSGMKMNQTAFTGYVRSGGPGTAGVGGRMPSYTVKVIPDQDLADIFAYVKTLPASTPAKNIPLLKQILDQN